MGSQRIRRGIFILASGFWLLASFPTMFSRGQSIPYRHTLQHMKSLNPRCPPAFTGAPLKSKSTPSFLKTSITLYVVRVGIPAVIIKGMILIIDAANPRPASVTEPVDSLKMFSILERITPSTIIFLVQHRVFGWSWTICLLLILAASSVFFAVVKRKPPVTALAWALL